MLLPDSNKIKILITLIVASCCSLVAGSEVQQLVNLHGQEYIQTRDELLKTLKLDDKSLVANPADSWQLDLMKQILIERLGHLKLFEKLPKVIQKASQNPDYKKMSYLTDGTAESTPYTYITGDVARYLQQGIEKKKYIKIENPTGLLGDSVQVEHTQTDEAVAKAKELNRAARMAVVEYLWKITDKDREKYELLDSLDRWIIYYYPKDGLMPLVVEIFKDSDYWRTVERSCCIFNECKYKEALPVVRVSFKRLYAQKNFGCCNKMIPYLERFGNDQDRKMVKEALPSLKQMSKDKLAEIEAEQKRILEEKRAKDKDDGGLIIK
jgi:hypothetical protein